MADRWDKRRKGRRNPWQVKRVESKTGVVRTKLSDAIRKNRSVRRQTKMIWKSRGSSQMSNYTVQHTTTLKQYKSCTMLKEKDGRWVNPTNSTSCTPLTRRWLTWKSGRGALWWWTRETSTTNPAALWRGAAWGSTAIVRRTSPGPRWSTSRNTRAGNEPSQRLMLYNHGEGH